MVQRGARQKVALSQRLESQNAEIVRTNSRVIGLNADLERTLMEVKRLTGLLPICSHCKAIRGDGGDCSDMETYISEHSEAEFSHGICPQCFSKHDAS